MSRDLDRRVAEEVFGIEVGPDYTFPLDYGIPQMDMDGTIHPQPLPHHSTDMTAAWQVVEVVSKMEKSKRRAFHHSLDAANTHTFEFDLIGDVLANLTAEDICLASLAAVGKEA